MNSIKTSLKPLTKKQETELFDRYIKSNRTNKAIREILIRSNIRFVNKYASKYSSYPIPKDDLINEGILGLIRAIDSFDHTRNLKFITYAVWWIKAYISKSLQEHINHIRLPNNQYIKLYKELKRTQNGAKMKEEIRDLYSLNKKVNFDEPVNGDSKNTYADIIQDNNVESPDEYVQRKRLETVSTKLLSKLNAREKTVIKSLFGIDSNLYTLEQLSEQMNLSNRQIKQVRDSAINKMSRDEIKEEIF